MALVKIHNIAAHCKAVSPSRQLIRRRQIFSSELITSRFTCFKLFQRYSRSQDVETGNVSKPREDTESPVCGDRDTDLFGVEEHYLYQCKVKKEWHSTPRSVAVKKECHSTPRSVVSTPQDRLDHTKQWDQWKENEKTEVISKPVSNKLNNSDFFSMAEPAEYNIPNSDLFYKRASSDKPTKSVTGKKSRLSVDRNINTTTNSFIDEQYFGDRANHSNTSVKQVYNETVKLKQEGPSVHLEVNRTSSDPDSAYIDGQYFGEFVKKSQPDPINNNASNKCNLKQNVSKVPATPNDMQSLSSIDKQYFGDYDDSSVVLNNNKIGTGRIQVAVKVPPITRYKTNSATTFKKQTTTFEEFEKSLSHSAIAEPAREEQKTSAYEHEEGSLEFKSKIRHPYKNTATSTENYTQKFANEVENNDVKQQSLKSSRTRDEYEFQKKPVKDPSMQPPINNRSGTSGTKPLKPESAYEMAMQFRANLNSKHKSNTLGEENPIKIDNKGFRILKNQVPNFTNVLTNDVVKLLRQNIIYNENDIVALNKPYGLPSLETKGCHVSINRILDKLLPSDEPLHMVQWLDRDVTGIVLLAKTQAMQRQLKEIFKKQGAVSKYWAIVKNKPRVQEGVVDIPLKECGIDGKYRMGAVPYYTPEMKGVVRKREGESAMTKFRILSEKDNYCLLECIPLTNIQHQMRVHLSFGLDCPILGDHKYSHTNTLAPQKLHTNMLKMLNIQQSKVRHVPMHLHLRSVFIENLFDYRYFHVAAPLPTHFLSNAKSLKVGFPHSKHAYKL